MTQNCTSDPYHLGESNGWQLWYGQPAAKLNRIVKGETDGSGNFTSACVNRSRHFGSEKVTSEAIEYQDVPPVRYCDLPVSIRPSIRPWREAKKQSPI